MFQYPCGISPCHTMRRHILRHHGIGGDNGTVANGNPWKNRRLVAYPHIIADDNGTLRGDRALSRRHQEAISISLAMRVVGDCHPFARQAIIANCHFVGASDMVIGAKAAMAANPQERFTIYPLPTPCGEKQILAKPIAVTHMDALWAMQHSYL